MSGRVCARQGGHELVRGGRAAAALAARLLVRVIARQECERVSVARWAERAAAGLLNLQLKDRLLAAREHETVVFEYVHLAHGTGAVL